MKKHIALVAIAGMVLATACKKTDDTFDPAQSGYPTDNLEIDIKQRVLLWETTGTWCQYCPNGAEKLYQALDKYGDKLVPIAHHVNDPIESTAGKELEPLFQTGSVPNFHVNTVNSGQDIDGKLDSALQYAPVIGVNHTIRENDTAFLVYPKVEFYEDALNKNFFIQSYILIDEIEARDFGSGYNLNQVSSVPTVSGQNPTRWVQDAAPDQNGDPLIKAGDPYLHKHVLWDRGMNTANQWGVRLDTVNALGNKFLKGDVFGTKYSPIVIAIEKDDVSPLPANFAFVTLIWKPKEDGSGEFVIENGIYTVYGSPKQ
ncbi:MAG: hypothetical protein LPK80_09590 [Bacteroidota bacterium]|nr:hypothetical protein [Bacteroidota bacterium]MDX5404612.1 hypothetical protein [Bacteroidota bacterium]MDX5428257.1 hypothetical protein [Bacteroidota bacterium]MDX5447363.1 hypothetical protein [Bacteroidota bacterium]MDX5506038.1 hypothetical protein [Bacteroidota bacterium]